MIGYQSQQPITTNPKQSQPIPNNPKQSQTISTNPNHPPEDMTPQVPESSTTCNQSPEALAVSRTPLSAACPGAEITTFVIIVIASGIAIVIQISTL